MIKTVLKQFDIKPNKSLGQNFLNDDFALARIIEELNPDKSDNVLEIGAGTGVLTERIALSAKSVIAVEIDSKLIPVLEKLKLNHENILVVNKDFLKLEKNELLEMNKGKAAKVAGNLPYYITTPILMKIIQFNDILSDGVFMVQEEFSHRIDAKPSSKLYGPLTILLDYYFFAQTKFRLEPDSFYPEPVIDSVVIKLTKKKSRDNVVIDDMFFVDFVKKAFTRKRRTFVNSLGMDKEIILEILSELDIKPDIRPQELKPEQYVSICNKILSRR